MGVGKFLFFALLFSCVCAEAKPKLNTTGTQSRDVLYATHGIIALPMRLVRPANLGKTPLPVVLYFHGGAWKNGSYEKLSPTLLDLARSGIAVASVEFRSSGEARFPAQLDDARAAVRWVKDNAKSYSLDAHRIGVYGLSTGGLFAGLLAFSGSSVKAACLQSAPCDLISLRGQLFDWQKLSSPLGALMASPQPPTAMRSSAPAPFSTPTKTRRQRFY